MLCKPGVAILAAPDAGGGGVQGTNFAFLYKDSSGNYQPVTGSGATNLATALDYLKNENGGDYTDYVIQLDADEALADRKTLSCTDKTIKVLIRGYSVERKVYGGTSAGLLLVGERVALTLGDKITLEGDLGDPVNRPKLANSALVSVEQGSFIMEIGSKISKVTLQSKDGAVDVGSLTYKSPGSVFIMNGGEISGNLAGSGEEPDRTPASYGAIFVRANGSFTMNGGTIKENTRGVVMGGQQASFTMTGGSIINNGSNMYPEGLRGAGVCVGMNQMAGAFTWEGGTINGNGTKTSGTTPPPGGELYVSSSTGVLTLNKASGISLSGTVCLTNTNQSLYPALILGPNFTNNPGDASITLDVASTQKSWVESWVGKQVLKLGAGSTSTIAALKGRFVLGNFFVSSGNKPFEPYNDDQLSKYMIDNDGKLVLRP